MFTLCEIVHLVLLGVALLVGLGAALLLCGGLTHLCHTDSVTVIHLCDADTDSYTPV